MTGAVRPKRAYRSPKRQEQAARTREKIIGAASDLFAEHGYGGTTMGAIARAAGVSVESVHATAPKATLLLESFVHGLSGPAQWRALYDLDGVKKIFTELDTDEALDRIASFLATAHARTARLVLEFRSVAATDPTVAAAWAEHVGHRRDSVLSATAWLIRVGIIEGDVPDDHVEALAATVATVISAETYVQLTFDWGFDSDQYRAWVCGRLRKLRS